MKHLALALLLVAARDAGAKTIHHYVFFNLDRAAIKNPAFLGNEAFAGAQIKYTWRQLEPEKDRYDFTAIRQDLTLLSAGVAVQEGNYAVTNPQTGATVTVEELVAFARDYLNVDCIFWFPEEPYFTRDALPYLARLTAARRH